MNREITGVVVREQASGENGKLLYVLTKSEGVLLVNAKGAKKISASYLKSVQLFAYSKMLIYDKNGYLTLTEATLIESFYYIRKDILALATASYICDVASLCSIPSQDEGILKLLLNTLYALNNSLASYKKIKSVFEYELCIMIGFALEASECENCGKPAYLYSFIDNAFFCKDCREHISGSFICLNSFILKALEYLNNCPLQKMLFFELDEDSMQVFHEFCEKYLIYNTDIKPKTLDFINSLEEM
ncbi:DNA repair protein RecO [Eubacteriales bacterium OttesenSCG-928-G02]|nr:DNA repair protein RecO [Eubacteriales bacterium OttesenSCG-928-G02]